MLAARILSLLLLQNAMDAETAGSRIFLLHFNHLFQERERELIVKNVPGNRFRVLVPFVAGTSLALIYETQHPFGDKTARLFANRCPLDVGLLTSFSNRLCKQDYWPNHFIVMLDGVGEVKPKLVKFLS
jgi:hypothetical protein